MLTGNVTLRVVRHSLNLFLLLGLLAGCAASGREPSSGTQIVVLWHTYTGPEAEALQTLADYFNARHRREVVLIIEYQRDIVEKLSATPPEHRPDLVVVWPEDLPDFMRLDLAVSRNQWNPPLENELDDLLPVAEALYSFDGDMQALPLGLATYLLYYNADWLGDLGYNAMAAGWEDLRRAACAATDPMGDQLGLGLSAQPGILLALLTAGGANIFTDGTYTFADQAGLQMAVGLNEILGGTCAYVANDFEGTLTRLASNSTPMIVESSLQYLDVERAVSQGRNFALRISVLPGIYGPGDTLWYGPGLMLIAPEGARRDVALDVMAWFFDPEAQSEWSRATHYLSARSSLLADQLAQPTVTPLEAQLLQIALQAAEEETGVAWPPYTNKMACRASLLRALLSLGGQSSPGAYIETAAMSCNTSIQGQP